MRRLAVCLALAGAAALAVLGIGGRGSDPRPGDAETASAAEERGAPAPGRYAVPAVDAGDHLIAKVRAGARLPVRSRPRGRVVGRVGDRTDFGSRTALAVIETRRGWLGVATPVRADGRLGWVRADRERLVYKRTDRSLHVDLSERRLELRAGRRVLRRTTVVVGRPDTPTPTGRFGVTDRIDGNAISPVYGCCIIALSARQPKLPPGWSGGNRIAIHGTPLGSVLGAAASTGCLRASNHVLRKLMLEVPLGTQVTIAP